METKLGEKTLEFSTGKYALQSNGSCMVKYGDNVILASAVMNPKGNEFANFFPLTVMYEERFYAAGKIKGSRFIKREGRPSENAILNSRMIDRPLRPLFPKGMTNETQIICTVMSTDLEVDPAPFALNAASAALMISGIPFEGPVGSVQIGLVDEGDEKKLVLNPTPEQVDEGYLDLVVAGTEDAITMVESGSKEVDEDTMLKALEMAHTNIKEICKAQKEFAEKHKKEMMEISVRKPSDEAKADIEGFVTEEMLNLIQGTSKEVVKDAWHDLEEKVHAQFAEKLENETYSQWDVNEVIKKLIEGNMRKNILEKETRIDGRKLDQVRELTCEVNMFPRTHGSALFQRGETQSVTITTLGSPGDAMIVDTMEKEETRRYMHFYNFPPYAVGEAKPMRGPSRRDIGHGDLGERSLLPVLPPESEYPYTMHLMSEIVTCNGSSSMAAVCGSSLSLMAAGVPIKSHIAGIAMGLIADGNIAKGEGTYKILTDIQGLEDFAGDMDFKVAGSRTGITALQMDIKVKGLTLEVMKEALMKAKEAREQVTQSMEAAIKEPNVKMSKYAPLLITIEIDPDKIRDVIGKGGETIQAITKECDVKMDIDDEGIVIITAPDQEKGEKAEKWVRSITYEPEAGEEFEGTVVKVLDFGAFVEFLPKKDGLVHISQISDKRVEKVEDVLNVGDKVKVKLLEVDKMGRYNLSMKDASGNKESDGDHK